MSTLSRIQEALVFAFSPPSVSGLGTSSGFMLQRATVHSLLQR